MTDTKSELFVWPYLGMQYVNIIRMSRLGALEVTQPNSIQPNKSTNSFGATNTPVHFCLTTKEDKNLFNGFLSDLDHKLDTFDAVIVENKTRDPQRASVFKVNNIASRLLYRVAKDNFDSRSKMTPKIPSDTKDSKTPLSDDEDEEEADNEQNLEDDAHYCYICEQIQNARNDPYCYLGLLYKFLKLRDSTTFIIDHKMQRGDIVSHEDSCNHNDGYFGVDSDRLVNLSESGNYGSVPDGFKVITQFPMNYWEKALGRSEHVSIEPHRLDIISVDYNVKFVANEQDSTNTAVIGDETVIFNNLDFDLVDNTALSIITVRNPLTPCGITYIIKFHALIYDVDKTTKYQRQNKITSQQQLYEYFINCDTVELHQDNELEGYLEARDIVTTSFIERNDRQLKVKEALLDNPLPKVLAGLISEYIA